MMQCSYDETLHETKDIMRLCLSVINYA